LAEKKIPVLTEVYNPNKGLKSGDASPVVMTDELLAKVISQVKPRLEAEITDYVLDELKAEISKARNEILSSTQDFIDRTKADLKTELPSMYQESVRLAQVNLTNKFADMHVDASAKFDASISQISDAAIVSAETDIHTRVAQSFENHMQDFQPAALAKSQALLETQLEKVNADAQETLLQQLQVFQQQMIEQHKQDLGDSLQAIQQSVQDSAQEAFSNELSVLQKNILETHQKQLSESLDGYLQTQGEAAEKALLQKVQEDQQKLHADYQQKLSEEMANALETIKQRVDESTIEQTDLMFTQVGTIQRETFTKLRQEFNDEKAAILNATSEEIRVSFAEQITAQSQEIREQFLAQVNGDLPEVQAVLDENIRAILSNTIPDMEQSLREQLTSELKQLLLKVKFVLPED
jgi:hypothetical protein